MGLYVKCKWCGKQFEDDSGFFSLSDDYCGEKCRLAYRFHFFRDCADERDAEAKIDPIQGEEDADYERHLANLNTVTLTVRCPHKNCSGDITASMPSEIVDGYYSNYGTGHNVSQRRYAEGKATVACETCSHSVKVSASGKTLALGPKGLKLGDEEDISIKQDRVCTKCRHYKPKHINARTWWYLLITTSVFLAIYLVLIGYVKTNWGDVTLFGFHVLTIAKYGLGGIGVVALLYLWSALDINGYMDLFERAGPHCLSKDVKGKELEKYGHPVLNRNLHCKFWE